MAPLQLRPDRRPATMNQPGERFQDALAYASELHAGQRRKAPTPPTSHTSWPSRRSCSRTAATKDEAIAALLHDAVEDQGGAPIMRTIRERFGDHVAGIVDGCSDNLREPEATLASPQDVLHTSTSRNAPDEGHPACRWQTSSTMRGQSWPTTASMARSSGIDSPLRCRSALVLPSAGPTHSAREPPAPCSPSLSAIEQLRAAWRRPTAPRASLRARPALARRDPSTT